MAPTDPAIRTALGLHEVMRRMGIPSEVIYINVDRRRCLTVLLGPTGFETGDPVKARTRKDVGRKWEKAIEWWNTTGTEAEISTLMDEFFNQVDTAKMIVGIRQAWALASLPEN